MLRIPLSIDCSNDLSSGFCLSRTRFVWEIRGWHPRRSDGTSIVTLWAFGVESEDFPSSMVGNYRRKLSASPVRRRGITNIFGSGRAAGTRRPGARCALTSGFVDHPLQTTGKRVKVTPFLGEVLKTPDYYARADFQCTSKRLDVCSGSRLPNGNIVLARN